MPRPSPLKKTLTWLLSALPLAAAWIIYAINIASGPQSRLWQWFEGILYLASFLYAAIPAALLWRRLSQADRWEREGRCRGCGYDRRGLEVTTWCPECGAGGIL